MNAFEVYQTFIALKLHFTSDYYDYHKYNGKTTVTLDSFHKRNDVWAFRKLAKHQDPFNYILANLIRDQSYTPIDYKVRDTDKHYYDWMKRIQSLTYTFQQDLNKLNPEFNSNFIIKKDKFSFECPNLLILYHQGEISPETATILVDLSDVSEYWLCRLRKGPTIFWNGFHCLRKYLPFLSYDKEKFRALVVAKWGTQHEDADKASS